MKCLIPFFCILGISSVFCQYADQPSLNIVETARRLGVVSYLLAMEETNSLDFLANQQGITVFMPTNEAFLKVSDTERAKWKSDPMYYKSLMKYHVLKGHINQADFHDEAEYHTFADNNTMGRFINYTGYAKSIQMYENAVVKDYDHEASNGVIHLLDDVVTQEELFSLLDLVKSNKDLSKLYDAITKNNLTEELTRTLPRTFLAPTNEAIGKLPNGTWDKLTNGTVMFNETMKLHLNDQGTWYTAPWFDKLSIPTLNPSYNWTITIDKDNKIFVNTKAQFVSADNAATNGVLHIVDTVLLPNP